MPDFGGKTHKNQLEMQIVILIQSKESQLKGKQLENAKCAPWVNSCELCFGKLRLLEKFLNARLLVPVGFRSSVSSGFTCRHD